MTVQYTLVRSQSSATSEGKDELSQVNMVCFLSNRYKHCILYSIYWLSLMIVEKAWFYIWNYIFTVLGCRGDSQVLIVDWCPLTLFTKKLCYRKPSKRKLSLVAFYGKDLIPLSGMRAVCLLFGFFWFFFFFLCLPSVFHCNWLVARGVDLVSSLVP